MANLGLGVKQLDDILAAGIISLQIYRKIEKMHLVIVLFSTMSHELEQPYVIFALEFYLQ